jgi:hypothetical protein
MAKTSIGTNNLSHGDQSPKMMCWPYCLPSMTINDTILQVQGIENLGLSKGIKIF